MPGTSLQRSCIWAGAALCRSCIAQAFNSASEAESTARCSAADLYNSMKKRFTESDWGDGATAEHESEPGSLQRRSNKPLVIFDRRSPPRPSIVAKARLQIWRPARNAIHKYWYYVIFFIESSKTYETPSRCQAFLSCGSGRGFLAQAWASSELSLNSSYKEYTSVS